MRIRVLVVLTLSLVLGGCIITSHSHFDPTKGGPISLRDGDFACVIERRAGTSTDSDDFQHTKLGRKIAQHLTAFSGIIQMMSLPDGSNRKLFIGKEDPTNASVYAFHDIGNGFFVAATGMIGEKQKHGYMYLFFRITDGAVTTLLVRDEELYTRLARDAGLDYQFFVVTGPAEKELAFLRSLPTIGALEPFTTCRPVAG